MDPVELLRSLCVQYPRQVQPGHGKIMFNKKSLRYLFTVHVENLSLYHGLLVHDVLAKARVTNKLSYGKARILDLKKETKVNWKSQSEKKSN